MLLLNENAIHLRLNPNTIGNITGTLPATIYDTEMVPVNGKLVTKFAVLPYTLETSDAERIAVDHVAKMGIMGELASSERESACKSICK
jgi:COP9 signalosome complex subunit 6